MNTTGRDTGTDEPLDLLVIGGGQAGLAVGFYLQRQGLRFLIVDAGARVGDVWRSRWDTLRLFTPAEYCSLPGLPFPAPAGTYPGKDDVADYLETYANTFALPVKLNTRVQRLSYAEGVYAAQTSRGTLRARQVVVATGPFQNPYVPAVARDLDVSVTQLHSAHYRRPSDIPRGTVLVVGAGNSGLQLADELARAGRTVSVAVGTSPRTVPQRPLGKDLFWWLTRLGLLSRPADSHIARRFRDRELVIGTSWRTLHGRCVAKRPRVRSTGGRCVSFEDGTSISVDAVVWATGFKCDYSWIDVAGAVVDGRPVHRRGMSPVAGLHYVGLPWQHTRGSALLGFVKDDAAWLVGQLDDRAGMVGERDSASV